MDEQDNTAAGVAPAAPDSTHPAKPMYTVAIGASAGGLDALEKLFDGLPADSGAAYVVIQHLSPDHKSMMAGLLSRHTHMPVVVVEDGMRLAPDTVHLIPPGALMRVDGEHLRLSPKEPRSFVLPIDVFFHSLAKHHGAYAVGIILSGTGSDGSRGAAAINEAGGFLLVQDPNEAKFDGMPRNAIATGLIDDVLPVEELAPRLLSHLSVQPSQRIQAEVQADSLELAHPDRAFAGILGILQRLGHINFEEYKTGTVMRRIERRMAVRQVQDMANYLDLLNHDKAEATTLQHDMLIPVTSFFRDEEAFAALAADVVAAIVAQRDAGHTIRVWCAGVSSGEEAYSVAMLFIEAFDQIKRWPNLKVFATDVNKNNVEMAAAGSFPESVAAEVSPQRLERFFEKNGARFTVKPQLRQCIVFAQHNLLTDPPFTKMDLVVCRNTLIYFRAPSQAKVLRRLQYALNPKGYLFLGSSESLGEVQDDFEPVNSRQKIWQMVRPSMVPLDISASSIHSAQRSPFTAKRTAVTRQRKANTSAVERAYSTLQGMYAPPPALLLNGGNEIVHSFGDMSPYLRIREGEWTLEYSRILVDPLVPVASALLFKSRRENSRVSSDPVGIGNASDTSTASATDTPPVAEPVLVRLTAVPACEVDEARFTLLIFEQVAPTTGNAHARFPSIDIGSETTERLQALEHELAATQESLQATIEELETSNEELQATNEEMMASNEELQSTNEELQSVNEELNTVNAEYQEKLEILNRINTDLENLTKVVSSSTVFVDEQLALVRFSPEAAQVFRLRESDLGRPLDDLNHELAYPSLIDDIRLTLTSGQLLEKDVPGSHRRHYYVRMLPYQVSSTGARGVVINLTEITTLRGLQNVIDALSEHVVVLDNKGQIVLVNRAWREFGLHNGNPHLKNATVGSDYMGALFASRGGRRLRHPGLRRAQGRSGRAHRPVQHGVPV